MKHKLHSHSRQWSKEGGDYRDAITWYECERCGERFHHRYNIQPNIYQAMAEQGFNPNVCKGKNDK